MTIEQLPRYGWFGGKGWSNPNRTPINSMDEIFRQHDHDYAASGNDRNRVLDADRRLLDRLTQLAPETLGSQQLFRTREWDLGYRDVAIRLFKLKVAAGAGTSVAGNAIQAATNVAADPRGACGAITGYEGQFCNLLLDVAKNTGGMVVDKGLEILVREAYVALFRHLPQETKRQLFNGRFMNVKLVQAAYQSTINQKLLSRDFADYFNQPVVDSFAYFVKEILDGYVRDRYGQSPARYVLAQFVVDTAYVALLSFYESVKSGHPQSFVLQAVFHETDIVLERWGDIYQEARGLVADRRDAVAALSGLVIQGAGIISLKESGLLSRNSRLSGFSTESVLASVRKSVAGTDIPEFDVVARVVLNGKISLMRRGGVGGGGDGGVGDEAIRVAVELDKKRPLRDKYWITSFGSYEKTTRALLAFVTSSVAPLKGMVGQGQSNPQPVPTIKPGRVTVNPPQGSWRENKVGLRVTSTGATTIRCEMRNSYDGREPQTPFQQCADLRGESAVFELYAERGQHKRAQLRFTGCNSAGCGPSTAPLSYELDLRQPSAPPTRPSPLPAAPVVNPSGGQWKSSPQFLQVTSAGATTIQCMMVNTYDGSLPGDPVALERCAPSAAELRGPSARFELFANPGQNKRTKLAFRGCNEGGCGPATGPLSYAIDRRGTPPGDAPGGNRPVQPPPVVQPPPPAPTGGRVNLTQDTDILGADGRERRAERNEALMPGERVTVRTRVCAQGADAASGRVKNGKETDTAFYVLEGNGGWRLVDKSQTRDTTLRKGNCENEKRDYVVPNAPGQRICFHAVIDAANEIAESVEQDNRSRDECFVIAAPAPPPVVAPPPQGVLPPGATPQSAPAPSLSIVRFEDTKGCCTTNTGDHIRPRIWVRNNGGQPAGNVVVRYQISSHGTGNQWVDIGPGTIEPRELVPGDTDEDRMDNGDGWRIPKDNAWKNQWHTVRACVHRQGGAPTCNPATDAIAEYQRASKK